MTTPDDDIRYLDQGGRDAAPTGSRPEPNADVVEDLTEVLGLVEQFMVGSRLSKEELARRRERIERAAAQRLAAGAAPIPSAQPPAPRSDGRVSVPPKETETLAPKAVSASPDRRRAAKRARVDLRRQALRILASAQQRADQIVAEAERQARRRVEEAQREASIITNTSAITGQAASQPGQMQREARAIIVKTAHGGYSQAAAVAAALAAEHAVTETPAGTGSFRRGTRLRPASDSALVVGAGAVGSWIGTVLGSALGDVLRPTWPSVLPDLLLSLPVRFSANRASHGLLESAWPRRPRHLDLLCQRAGHSPPVSVAVLQELVESLGCQRGSTRPAVDRQLHTLQLRALYVRLAELAAEPDVVPAYCLTDTASARWVSVRSPNRQTPPGSAAETGTGPAPTTSAGYSCPHCGCWVVDTTAHTDWHAQQLEGQPAPAIESTNGIYIPDSVDVALLEAMGTGCR